MQNQYSRTQLLLGAEAMEKLHNSRVAVFGIGGVGGYTVEALALSLIHICVECTKGELMTTQTPDSKPRALIAMSGGVDSSVAAWLMPVSYTHLACRKKDPLFCVSSRCPLFAVLGHPMRRRHRLCNRPGCGTIKP